MADWRREALLECAYLQVPLLRWTCAEGGEAGYSKRQLKRPHSKSASRRLGAGEARDATAAEGRIHSPGLGFCAERCWVERETGAGMPRVRWDGGKFGFAFRFSLGMDLL